MAFKLTWLPTVLKNAGLKVAEVDGWPNRGVADMPAAKGVMCHHTAGPAAGNMPSLRVLVNGRPDLPGPLCQLGLGRDGTYYVIAAGRANHAGVGQWEGITAGNAAFIGIEAENMGLPSDPWPAIQLEAYQRGAAAILKHLQQGAIMCCGHKEYALPKGRKPDPHSINMTVFRRQVAKYIAGEIFSEPIPWVDPLDRPTLRRGAPDNPKFLVQIVQRKVGITGNRVDGIFGPMTEAAVRQFQREHGLVPDGIVGPKTWQVIFG